MRTKGDILCSKTTYELGDDMPLTTRELFAKLLKCEAGGEGDNGMRAVASIVMNRANVDYGEFSRVSQGGNVRNIIVQPDQFTCMLETIGGVYNSQNVFNMDPDEIQYEITDWALSGNTASSVGSSLFYFNPYNPQCPPYFPSNRAGVIFNRINQHCFYTPTSIYAST